MHQIDFDMKISKTVFIISILGLLITTSGCQDTGPETAQNPANELAILPTLASPIEPIELIETEPETQSGLPATWTPDPISFQTATPIGSFDPTPRPSFTPFPTLSPSPTPLPTDTPIYTATPEPPPTQRQPPGQVTPSSASEDAANILNNPSFEGDWYHQGGDPELQIPSEWRFEFTEGENSLDPDPWNKWVRPEVRVIPKEFLPLGEHDLFIWEGDQTLKIFKGQGAINVRLLTTQNLPAGTYQFTVFAYPDLVVDYTNSGRKVFADEREAGEVQFLIDGKTSGWFYPTVGTKNRLSYSFVIEEEHQVTLGIAIRGRWAILNNGWFFDDFRLQQIN